MFILIIFVWIFFLSFKDESFEYMVSKFVSVVLFWNMLFFFILMNNFMLFLLRLFFFNLNMVVFYMVVLRMGIYLKIFKVLLTFLLLKYLIIMFVNDIMLLYEFFFSKVWVFFIKLFFINLNKIKFYNFSYFWGILSKSFMVLIILLMFMNLFIILFYEFLFFLGILWNKIFVILMSLVCM